MDDRDLSGSAATYEPMGGGDAVPGVGQEPVSGQPDELEVLVLQCRRTAAALRADQTSLRRGMLVEGWSGEASRAFGRSVAGLPHDLDLAAEAYEAVAGAVAAYAAELRSAQRRSRLALADLDHAERLRPVLSTPFLDPLLQQDQGPMTPAEVAGRARRVAEYEARRGAALRQLAAARDDADRAAAVAARRVRAASVAPHGRPGWLERAGDGLGDWVEEHAEDLADVAGVLTIVSTLATALAFVPALTPVVAPLAAAAAVVALAINAALAARGRTPWQGVLVDTVTTAVPGGRVAGTAVRSGARGSLGAAGDGRRSGRARAALARVLDQQAGPEASRRRTVEQSSTPCD